jgi:hypothetical protein
MEEWRINVVLFAHDYYLKLNFLLNIVSLVPFANNNQYLKYFV